VSARAERNLAIARLARRQESCFTVAQAVDAGFPPSTVYARVRSGEWAFVDQRVLRATSAGPMTWRQNLMAACLATGGVASHQSAAALVDLAAPPPVPHVTTARAQRGHRRLAIHSSLSLPPSDIVRVGAIPATSPVRTLIDCAGVLPAEKATFMVDDAITRSVVGLARLERRARELESPGRPGARAVREIIASAHPDLESARNGWEALMLRLCAQHGLPEPVPNHAVEVNGRTRYLDLAWPEILVFAEFDGRGPHSIGAVFDDDRARQNELTALCWIPFRFTAANVRRDAEAASAPLARTVRARMARV
jgi:hypothetical protein